MDHSLTVVPGNLPNRGCEIWPIVSANRLDLLDYGPVVLLLLLLEKRAGKQAEDEPNRLVRR